MDGQLPPLTVIEYALLLAQPFALVAVMVKLNVPLVVSDPLKTPVAGFKFNPGGSEPLAVKL